MKLFIKALEVQIFSFIILAVFNCLVISTDSVDIDGFAENEVVDASKNEEIRAHMLRLLSELTEMDDSEREKQANQQADTNDDSTEQIDAEKRASAFLRFGRPNDFSRTERAQAFLRFGKSPAYLRFGKRSPAYLRFGRGPNPAFLRFGRSAGDE